MRRFLYSDFLSKVHFVYYSFNPSILVILVSLILVTRISRMKGWLGKGMRRFYIVLSFKGSFRLLFPLILYSFNPSHPSPFNPSY